MALTVEYAILVVIGFGTVILASALLFGPGLTALSDHQVLEALGSAVRGTSSRDILVSESRSSAIARMDDGSLYLVFVSGDHVNLKEISSGTVSRIVDLGGAAIRFRFRGLSVASRIFVFPDSEAAVRWRPLLAACEP